MAVETRGKKLFRETVEELAQVLEHLSVPIPELKKHQTSAFGSGIENYEQWLKYVFLPRAQQIASGNEDLPVGSALGEVADRTIGYFDEHPLHRRISAILKRIDLLCEGELIEALLSVLEEKLAQRGTPHRETEAFVESTRKSLEDMPAGEQVAAIEALLHKL